MKASKAWILLIACLAVARSQVLRTLNGSMLLEIPGATLTLSPSTPTTGSGAITVASQQDITVATQNTLAALQPQVKFLVIAHRFKIKKTKKKTIRILVFGRENNSISISP